MRDHSTAPIMAKMRGLMRYIRYIAAMAALLCVWTATAAAASLQLFGVPLQTATKASLAPAFAKAGLPPITQGLERWFDTYRVNGQPQRLQGASMLTVDYTAHNRFAIAEYEFASFNNPHQIQQIITMVAYKYGRPTEISGDVARGPVIARWKEAHGTELKVWRGWPATSTYMDLEDVANLKRLRAQTHGRPPGIQTLKANNMPIAGARQWEPPAPSELVTPPASIVPPSLTWEIALLFAVPALAVVVFAHYIARMTRVPRSFRVAMRVITGKILQAIRHPTWLWKGHR